VSRMGEVTFGGARVSFRLIRAKRKTMEIAVHPDSRVVVKAPWGSKPKKVLAKVKKRAQWILKQQKYFAQFQPRTPARRYCSGETHLFLGHPYRLKVVGANEEGVALDGRILRVKIDGAISRQKTKSLLDDWYRQHAYRVFGEILEGLWVRFKNNVTIRPKIHVRRMNSRWGSLAPSGVLTVKLDLIQTPKPCIEYVIAHELCHLVFQDHGPNFHKLLENVMPDWEKRKHRLELALI
jgi:predicted metal-dependent hydrolase